MVKGTSSALKLCHLQLRRKETDMVNKERGCLLSYFNLSWQKQTTQKAVKVKKLNQSVEQTCSKEVIACLSPIQTLLIIPFHELTLPKATSTTEDKNGCLSNHYASTSYSPPFMMTIINLCMLLNSSLDSFSICTVHNIYLFPILKVMK